MATMSAMRIAAGGLLRPSRRSAPDQELSAPSVNIFNPSTTEAVVEFEEMVRRDLSPLGEVVSLSGMWAQTKQGFRVDNVVARVEKPSVWSVAVFLNVGWDEKQGQPTYRSLTETRYVPKRNGYRDLMNDQERRVVADVLERGTRRLKFDLPEYPGSPQEETVGSLRVLTAPVVPIGASVATSLTPWVPLVEWGLIGASVAAGGVLLWSSRKYLGYMRSGWSEVKAKVDQHKAWRGNGEAAIASLFRDESEKTIFLNALLTECERAGRSFSSNLRLYNIGVNTASPEPLDNVVRATGRLKGHSDRIPRRAVVAFTSTEGPRASETLIYDGEALYRWWADPHNGDYLLPI